MSVNKVVYGTTVLVDLTSDTVTADKLLQGYTAHDKAGNSITGTMTSGGGSDREITGSFTPASASGTYTVTVPKMPRAVFVVSTYIGTNIDRYELQSVSVVNPNSSMANGNSVHVSARYKSSTSSGTTFSQVAAYNAYSWNSSYTSTGASQYYYAVCVTANTVYFKQSGNYRFRQGVQYDYYIIFD